MSDGPTARQKRQFGARLRTIELKLLALADDMTDTGELGYERDMVMEAHAALLEALSSFPEKAADKPTG